MVTIDLARSLENLKLEQDAIALYDALASFERDPRRASAFRRIAANERRHAEIWASKLRAAPGEMIPMFRREDIHVVVVGGETNGYWRIMGCNYQKTGSVDAWR